MKTPVLMSKTLRVVYASAAIALVATVAPTVANALQCGEYDIACDGPGDFDECLVCWPGPGGGIDIECETHSRVEVRLTLGESCPLVEPTGPGLTGRVPEPRLPISRPRYTAS